MKTDIELDALQHEAELLLQLLNDRQPGLSTWWDFLNRRLRRIRELTT